MWNRIKYFLPSLYGNDTLIRSIVESFRKVTDELQAQMRYEFNQLSASTADEFGIVEWEKELAITPHVGAILELRRAMVRSKLMRLPTVTPERLTAIANQFTYTKSARVVHLKKTYILKAYVFMDDVVSTREMYNEIYAAKPAHLMLYIVLNIFSTVPIAHESKTMEHIRADQYVWNLGSARSTHWNREFFWDGTIRWDGIYPDELYRERQLHIVTETGLTRVYMQPIMRCELEVFVSGKVRQRVAITYHHSERSIIQSTQAVLILQSNKGMHKIKINQATGYRYRNMWNGGFCWDGSRTWDGLKENATMINHDCIVRTIKNGVEGAEEKI